MTNPTAWAEAVEDAREASNCPRYYQPEGQHEVTECDACVELRLRAALPHLLRAVVGGTRWTNGQWMLYRSPDELLAALTDAVGRAHLAAITEGEV